MTNRYTVIHHQIPAALLSKPIVMDMSGGNRTRLTSIGNMIPSGPGSSPKKAGIAYVSSLRSESIESAIQMSRQDVEYISALVSLLTGVAASHPSFFLAFTTDDDISSHRLVQCEQLDVTKVPSLTTDSDAIKEIADRISSLTEPSIRLRTVMSLRLYRRAQATPDPIERFLLLWLAAEYLEYILAKRIGAVGTRKCSKCGSVLACPNCGALAGPPSTLGLMAFVERTRLGEIRDLKLVTELRGKLIHGGGDLDSIIPEVHSRTAFLVDLYISALAFILDHPSLRAIAATRFAHSIELQMQLDARIEFSAPGPLQIDQNTIPQFEIKHESEPLDFQSASWSEKHRTDLKLVRTRQYERLTINGTAIGIGVNITDFSAEKKGSQSGRSAL